MESSLIIVCFHGGKYYIHCIKIKIPSGSVEGRFGDDLPLVDHMFVAKEGKEIVTADCVLLRPGGLFFLGNRWKGSIEARQIDICEPWDNRDPEHRHPFFPIELQNRVGDRFYNPYLFAIAGIIYLLTYKVNNSGVVCGVVFERFNHLSNQWESLPLPAFLSGKHSLKTIAGYVVDDLNSLVVFCFEHRSHVEFYCFNVLTKLWQLVSIKTEKIDDKGYDPYFPYYMNKILEIYPFYGRAELVDGVIYGCLLRTVVTYRMLIDEGSCSVHLEALGLYSFDVDDAPAFSAAPLGKPILRSRCINHLGKNMFCVVETLSHEYPIHIQEVYITTFNLPFYKFDHDEPGGMIDILDSTIRLVDNQATSMGCDCARIISCHVIPPGSVQDIQVISSPESLCTDLRKHVNGRVIEFCKLFLSNSDDREDEATVLYFRHKSQLQKSKTPIVKFFLSHMEYLHDNGPEPDFLLLLNKRKDKGLVRRRRNRRHVTKVVKVFMISVSEQGPCALYELEISKNGVIGGRLISPRTVLDGKNGMLFSSASFGNVGDDVYFFPSHWETAMITHYFVVNVKKNISNKKAAMPEAPKQDLTVISCDSKLYVISAPSHFPDSIPKPAFECFDTASVTWEILEDAPFHSKSMDREVYISGYAVLDYHILISLNNYDCDFYSYNFCTKKWTHTSKDVDGDYRPFHGKAEYVDGKIYLYFCNKVFEYVVRECGDGMYLEPPVELDGLKVVSPPVPWRQGRCTYRMVHLGETVFCAITTGACSFTGNYQYACISTFSVSKSSDIQTWHSTVRVLDNKGLGWADIYYCFLSNPEA